MPHLSFCKINHLHNAAFGTRVVGKSYQFIIIPCRNTGAVFSTPECEVSGGLSCVLLGVERKRV